MSYTYPKSERLKSKKDITSLFEKGKWQTCGNIRLIFTEAGASKIGVSVSKRYFKKATDRNRVKRLLRECYRLNKELFHQKFGATPHAMIFWVSAEMPKKYQLVEEDFIKLCKK
ncbi:ribonuclease P protein component [Riemerella anatipestifer]|uniref:Ribonuclease P protein component n=1 Tax=Riemerella anatipestifer RA-CH-1 TaxID=1228997 RepID=J9R0E8_RIEAN|nr:ribonuclease P protein component [Riemerella anatipestifer]AFR35159.1 hypothetical protein B739_0555 [Riemerella anatipestifer RA-CH-1]AIH02177.1 ribonuclease p protein component [Riemerella anatipestifer CH3]MCO7332409.1 ribonuclease P protein component [Riemerella anatipestifer]MCO7351225.1 ribonuclease P protein component [Riemerella anatipestifer]MCU7581813.1 ribonuclease P protein component [Riemerella anatipestifer]